MVMVSHKHAFIFLKSRKTAGTSIEMVLEPLCGPRRAEITEETPARVSAEGIIGRRVLGRPRHVKLMQKLGLQKLGLGRMADWNNHMAAAEIRTALGAEKWNRYRKITSIRDPFHRAVSAFNYLDARAGVPADEDFATVRARFNDWIARKRPNSDKDVLFLDGQFVADTVIRFETLAADLQALYSGFDPEAGPIRLYHAKDVGRRRSFPIPDYFTKASIAILQQESGWLIERFGYPDRPQPKAAPPSGARVPYPGAVPAPV